MRQPAAHRRGSAVPPLLKIRAKGHSVRKFTAFSGDMWPISLYEEQGWWRSLLSFSLGLEVCLMWGRGGVGWV
jgi:hypothetical protein